MADSKFRILQTCFSRSWGGLELQALEVSKSLHQRGHSVLLACCTGSRLAQEATHQGIEVITLDLSGYFHPSIVWKLSRLLPRRGINIIHCQLSKDIATLVPAMKLAGGTIPILLSKRVGSYINKKDLFHRFTYANVRMVLAISDVIRKNVMETTPVPPARVITLHDAIDAEKFSLRHIDRHTTRRELGVGDDSIVIGFVGRFSPGKGHEEFIEAAGLLREKYTNLQFLVVGEASYGEEEYERTIKGLCSEKGLQTLISFTGYRKDVPAVMAAFDIFAFPSHAESFGVVLIEAMAMERPVVSTNCDGVLDIVVHGETGMYVHPRNSGELADALSVLIENPALRIQMGKAGRKRVEELFDRKKQMDELERIYSSLLTKKK